MAMLLVNIGCGGIAHPAWVNLDLVPDSPNVRVHDMRGGLPFGGSTVDVCYSSHVVEHLAPEAARIFMRECYRVLKVGGILRTVVPDHEAIVNAYLEALARARSGEIGADREYDWMMIELLDQMVRDRGGGEMAPFLRSVENECREFIRGRIGLQAEPYWRPSLPRRGLLAKLKRNSVARVGRWARERLAQGFTRGVVFALLGSAGARALDVGLFREGGQVHQWAYDAYSMTRLLKSVGFQHVAICSAYESLIPRFETFELDVVSGVVLKPNSLFAEAVKGPAPK